MFLKQALMEIRIRTYYYVDINPRNKNQPHLLLINMAEYLFLIII